MTVSAAVRLIPSPPALVHSRNTNLSESRGKEGAGRGEIEGSSEREGNEEKRSQRERKVGWNKSEEAG